MAEVLRSFDEVIADETGAYQARVVGRLASDRMWEGWLEFLSLATESPEVFVTPVESRQPEREHIAYWASGLTVTYAEGALKRALRPAPVRTRVVDTPASHAPAPPAVTVTRQVVGPEPVLDPIEIGSKSIDILVQELGALGRPRLLNIIAAYDLNPGSQDLQQLTDQQLITFIAVAVDIALTSKKN